MRQSIVWLLILLAGLVVGDYESCTSSAEQNEVEYRWGVTAGCSYKHPSTGI